MNPITSPLLTDLYQLTMFEAYLREGMDREAVFEFAVRNLPPGREFLLAAGLESALSFLEDLRFSEAEIDVLARTGRFSKGLLAELGRLRFTGDLYALPEGTPFFAGEPLLRVVAPLPLAQLVETRVMNLVHCETILASKAARCRLAAGEKTLLVDFGLRRAHGAEAGLFAARASYIAGFAGTATVLAGALYGIPLFGTMAHSYIEAFPDELSAFVAYARANRENVTFLIDTYDTLQGARQAIRAARILAPEGIRVKALRLDSGDFLSLSREVRALLNQEGLPEVQVFVSGNMDEYAIRDLLAAGAPIGGFGGGTKLDTSADAPYLECAYKLVEYAGRPRLKASAGKATLPGRKQVFRRIDEGRLAGDTVALEGEAGVPGEPLLMKVMEKGRRLFPALELTAIARHAQAQLESLPEGLRRLDGRSPYEVQISPGLRRLQEETLRSLGIAC
ncbi:MAG: nicotinate phosphoribosyltransferase [Deltaproteobacteria bacterium]|nr:nicotinate phosphoribosyltransferase [Deltaproteobacteria bacterium]